MNNVFKLISFLIITFFITLNSFAIDVPGNLKLDSIKENTVDISWDVVNNSFMYYVKYDTNSGLKNGYKMQTDFIESTGATISDLEIGTTYYFSVISLDENGEESMNSNELVIDIVDNTVTNIDFALSSIDVIDKKNIELSFNNLLNSSTGAVREFKIVNKKDALDTFEVISNELNKDDTSKLVLTLDRELIIGDEYEVIVIGIVNDKGENIKSGIDNTETFIVPEGTQLNSAKEELSGPIGTNLTLDQVENTTLALAKKQENLPQTGVEHIFIVILSILLGSLIFIFKYKKV